MLAENSMNTTRFREERARNRASYIAEKRKNEAKHNLQVAKAIREVNGVKQGLDYLVNNEKELLEGIETSSSFLEDLKKQKESFERDFETNLAYFLQSKMYNELRILKGGDVDSLTIKSSRKYFLKCIEREIQNCERKLKMSLVAVKDSIPSEAEIGDFSQAKKERDLLYETITKIYSFVKSEDYTKIAEFINALKIGLREEYAERANTYTEVLIKTEPEIKINPRETAKRNMKLLEEEAQEIKKEKNSFLDSLEGILLAYCAYQISGRRTENEGEELEAAVELYNKAIEKLLLFREKYKGDVIEFLDRLRAKEYISEDELVYLRKEIKRELGIEKKEKESVEDVGLKAEYLSDVYRVPTIKALKIAKSIALADIDRIERCLSMNCGAEIAKSLIGHNPDIFLMNENECNRLSKKITELVALSSKYNLGDNFHPVKTPKNFSSFEALSETRRIMYNMLHEIPYEEGEREEDKDEIETIKINLANEGYSNMAWNIIYDGFYYNGEYFIGSHRMSIDNLKKNARRNAGKNFDDRKFHHELNKLIREGVVLHNRGYSINPKTKEFESEALRAAVRYRLGRLGS